jgi:DNA-binding transcriptional LysR family regulator
LKLPRNSGRLFMEMHQVRYFLALREELHFTRCGVAQPSLTRAIKMLENELGGPLFDRERGNIRLSELGEAIAPFLENLNWCAQSANRKAADFKSSQHRGNGGTDAQMGLSPRDHSGRGRELGLSG